jgi:alkaline phosphatase
MADENIPYEINRDNKTHPSLAEMTGKALEFLNEENEAVNGGFVLLVFGSRIDHAARASDAATLAREVLAFDEAVYEAIKFQAHVNQQTLILAVSPFEAGGLVLGQDPAGSGRDMYPEELKTIKASLDVIASAVFAQTAADNSHENIERVLEAYGIEDVQDEEVELFQQDGVLNSTATIRAQLLKLVTDRTMIGFTTYTRTGIDTSVFARGDFSEKIKGKMQNDQFGRLIATIMGADLDQATSAVKYAAPLSGFTYFV